RPTPEQATWLPLMFDQSGIHARHLVMSPQVIKDIIEGTRLSQSVFLPHADDLRGPSTDERMQTYVAEAGRLALSAAQKALDRSGLQPRQITHLVTVSCTGFRAPAVD